MEVDTDVFLSKVFAPVFYPVLGNARIYWLYLLTALALAAVAYGIGRTRRSLVDFLRYCFPKAVYGHDSTLLDVKYFFVSRVSWALVFAPAMIGAPLVAEWTTAFLRHLTGHAGLGVSTGLGIQIAVTIAWIVAFDFAIFFGHWLQHKVPALWEFHKVHHSAPVLTPLTVYRVHPMDDVLYGWFVGLTTGGLAGVVGFIAAEPVEPFAIFGLNAVMFGFYLAGFNLRHTHVWLSYPAAVSHVFISPAQHQIHHSTEERHLDKNMGYIFAVWDWLFGTLYVPKEREAVGFGLTGGEHREFTSLWRLYTLPFRKLATSWRRPRP